MFVENNTVNTITESQLMVKLSFLIWHVIDVVLSNIVFDYNYLTTFLKTKIANFKIEALEPFLCTPIISKLSSLNH